MTAVIDNPILNSPFVEPGQHWVLDDRGIPTGAIDQGRRRSEYIVPVPPPRHITQGMLDLDDEYGKRKPNVKLPRAGRGSLTVARPTGRCWAGRSRC
jgi:type III restriction enzyme